MSMLCLTWLVGTPQNPQLWFGTVARVLVPEPVPVPASVFAWSIAAVNAQQVAKLPSLSVLRQCFPRSGGGVEAQPAFVFLELLGARHRPTGAFTTCAPW